MSAGFHTRRLGLADLGLIGRIDRSEHVAVTYEMAAGRLVAREVDLDIPAWSSQGSGDHSVAGVIETWRPVVAGGASLVGAFAGDEVLGAAIIDGSFEPGLAWLAFLHVGREYRRRGVATALWATAAEIAVTAGARSIYVSAAPTGSAVGFYLSRGCVPADPPHPGLFAKEPDDIHLECPVAPP